MFYLFRTQIARVRRLSTTSHTPLALIRHVKIHLQAGNALPKRRVVRGARIGPVSLYLARGVYKAAIYAADV